MQRRICLDGYRITIIQNRRRSIIRSPSLSRRERRNP
jgi:hypothetical protein